VSHVTVDTLRRRLADHVPQRATGPGLIQAAVAIVLAPGERGELDLLFIRRAEEPADPWSGQMALPGGRREDDDPDLMTTAMRETFEETAVELPRQSLLGELDDLAPTTPVLPPIMVRPFVFGLGDKPEVVPSPEVALHLWTPLDGLPGSLGESEVSVRGVDLTRPAYLIGPHVVWGITYRILSRFFELIGSA
jgi:8-oxo-dGTP pyrophosphatase MutT (NUDIX family)